MGEAMLNIIHPFKIILNTFFDLLSFACSEFFNKPIMRILSVLFIVAAILPMTQRYHIRGNSSGTIRRDQRYPMIHSDGMKESAWSSANGALIIKIFKSAIKIVGSKIMRQSPFSRAAMIFRDVTLIAVLIAPLIPISFMLFAVVIIPLSRSPFPISGIFLFSFVAIGFYLIRIFISPIFVTSFYFFREFSSPFYASNIIAFAANGSQPVPLIVDYNKILTCLWVFIVASRTALKGIRIVEHSVSLSLYLMMRSAGGEISRWFGYPLADAIIIPRKAAL